MKTPATKRAAVSSKNTAPSKRPFSAKRKFSRTQIEAVDDFESELAALSDVASASDGGSDLDDFEGAAAFGQTPEDDQDYDLYADFKISSSENEDPSSDEEDVGKREFVPAQSDDDDQENASECEADARALQKQQQEMSAAFFQKAKSTLSASKFNFKLFQQLVSMLATQVESIFDKESAVKASAYKKAASTDDASFAAFENLLNVVLVDGAQALRRHLACEKLPKNAGLSASPAWKRSSRAVKAAAEVVVKLVRTVSNADVLLSVLRLIDAQDWLAFCEPFPRLVRSLSHALMNVWSGYGSATTSDEKAKVAALLLLRKMVVEAATARGTAAVHSSLLKSVVRGVYLRFASACKAVTVHNVATVNFMLNSIAEIYGIGQHGELPPAAADAYARLIYHFAFVFVRALALCVRSLHAPAPAVHRSRDKSSKEASPAGVSVRRAFKQVFGWQFVCCVRFWCTLVANAPAGSCCRLLAYPLVQLISGVLAAFGAKQLAYFPFYVHILRALLSVSSGCDVFVPVAGHALGMLQTLTAVRPATASSASGAAAAAKPVDFAVVVKVSKAHAKTRLFADAAVEQVASVLLEALACPVVARSPAFATMAAPVKHATRNLTKHSKSAKMAQALKEIIAIVDSNVVWCAAQQASAFEALSPLEAHWQATKKVADARRKTEYALTRTPQLSRRSKSKNN